MPISKATKFTLLFLSMMTVMSNIAIVTSIPHLKEYFSDVAEMELYSRLMITLPSLSIALLAPFLGHFLHRFKKRDSVMFGLFFFSLLGSAGLYLETIEGLLLSRALFGVSVAILMIISTALVGDYFRGKERNKYMGLQSAFSAIGAITFLLGGGFLSDIDWRYPFGIYLMGMVVFPFVLLFLKEPESEVQEEGEEGSCTSLLGIYFLAFIIMLLFFTLPTQMPFLMINVFGVSGTLTGMIIATSFVTNTIGAVGFARLKEHLSFGQIYLLGMALISIGFYGIGLVKEVHYFFLTSAILGFGGGILMANNMVWMLSKADVSQRIKSSGYITSALFFGQFLSPIVFHPLVSFLGVQQFFEWMGIVIFVVVLLVVFIRQIMQKRVR